MMHILGRTLLYRHISFLLSATALPSLRSSIFPATMASHRAVSEREHLTRRSTHYYPLTPPTDIPPNRNVSRAHHTYDSNNLPKNNRWFHRRRAEADESNATATETGIESLSILSRLPSIRFPYSFPIDLMHLIYLGLTSDLVLLLNGSYFSAAGKARDTTPAYTLSERTWREIGKEMGNARIPNGYGRQTRNIDKYLKSFKSDECATFLHNLLLHLLKGRVSGDLHTMFVRFWEYLLQSVTLWVCQ